MTAAAKGYRVVRTVSVDLNPQAQCQECPDNWTSHPDTLPSVKAHVQRTGHEVLVTRSTRSVYVGVAR